MPGKGNMRMEIPKIYLETTMFNFPFVPDKPGYAILKADTKKVFDLIRAGRFESFTSVYVDAELQKTGNEERRENMKSLVIKYKVKILPASAEILSISPGPGRWNGLGG
jgi:hypothetical protein